MFKLSSTTYYKRHDNEVSRYINSDLSWINIIKKDNKYPKVAKYKNNFLQIDKNITLNDLDTFHRDKFDTIVITDIFEITDDIYNFLKIIGTSLKPDGKILLTTINPKWNSILLFFEKLKLKGTSLPRSYIHNKKINSIVGASGYEIINSYSRQVFPFRLRGLGDLVNNIFEFFLLRFNLGIINYTVLNNISNVPTKFSKTIIIPAKNEELNLKPLFEKIPNFDTKFEIIFVCGKSDDKTFEVANEILRENRDKEITVIDQKSKGKGPGVLEAFDISKYETIAILDSDISVNPETLNDFFEIIENGHADFVNGTRFIYKMEKGAMRKLNSIGNIFFQYIISLVISNKLTDSLCGTKVFKKDLLEDLEIWRNNLKAKDPFGDFDLIFSAAYSGKKILEYPVHYKSRVYGSTQISRFSDGLKLLIYFVNSLIIFNTSNNE